MGASLNEALLSNKPSTFVGKTPCPSNSFQMIPEWFDQLVPCAMPSASLGSSIDKLRVLSSWRHIPFWGYQIPPSSGGTS